MRLTHPHVANLTSPSQPSVRRHHRHRSHRRRNHRYRPLVKILAGAILTAGLTFLTLYFVHFRSASVPAVPTVPTVPDIDNSVQYR